MFDFRGLGHILYIICIFPLETITDLLQLIL